MKLRYSLMALSLVSSLHFSARSLEVSEQTPSQADLQMQQQAAMQYFQELNAKISDIFYEQYVTGMVALRVNHHQDFEWLKINYYRQKDEGDKRIVTLKDEFVTSVLPKIKSFFAPLFNQLPAILKNAEMQQLLTQFEDQFTHQLPLMVEQSLKLGMLVESTAYARLHNLQ